MIQYTTICSIWLIYEFKYSKIIKMSTLISIFKVFTKSIIIPDEIDIARPMI